MPTYLLPIIIANQVDLAEPNLFVAVLNEVEEMLYIYIASLYLK